MAFFLYQAFSKTGKRISGTIEAQNQTAVREKLLSEGLYPVSVVLQQNADSQGSFFTRLFSRPLTLKDKLFFTKQLAILLKSGIALTEALNLMIDQSPSYMRSMLSKMRDELKEGLPFATTLAAYPKSFPPLYVQLIRAGEASGQIDKVLLRLAIFLEEEDAFNKAIKKAMQDPLIQLGMVFGVAGFLLTTIVPKMAEVLDSLSGGKKLPAITIFILNLSDALLNHYLLVIIFIASVYGIYTAWSQSAWGKLLLDTWKLKLPVISYFTRTVAIVQFSQTLGLLLESGVNIAEALDIVVQIVDNQILVLALQKARDNIIKQGKVADYLQKTGLFSAVDIHLIGTGEQSGALDAMLTQVGKYNQEDIQEYAQGLTALLNPISMVLLTIIIGTIMAAVMLPLLGMSSAMGG